MESISMGDSIAGGFEELVFRSRALLGAHRYHDVIALLDPIRHASDTQSSIEEFEKLELLGRAFYETRRYSEASDSIEKAGLIRPISPSSRIRLASCYSKLGRQDLARELFLQVTLSTELPAALIVDVSRGLREVRAVRLASQVCERALRSTRENPLILFELGVCLSHLDEPRYRVEALVHRAMTLAPHDTHYRAALATILFAADEADQALALLAPINQQQIDRLTCSTCCERVSRGLRRMRRTTQADMWTVDASMEIGNQNDAPCLAPGVCGD